MNTLVTATQFLSHTDESFKDETRFCGYNFVIHYIFRFFWNWPLTYCGSVLQNLSQNWLFDRLITHIYWCVYIFSEYKVKSGDNIIRQGDDGDNFYVVESGLYNIYVNTANGNQLVGKCEDSGSFGELALMYNSKFVFKPNSFQN